MELAKQQYIKRKNCLIKANHWIGSDTFKHVFKVYDVTELSKDAFNKAYETYLINIDYPFLEEELKTYTDELLKENNIKPLSPYNLRCSLSYCQGDGASLTGSFFMQDKQEANLNIKIKSESNHYVHEKSVSYKFYNDDGDILEDVEDIKDLFVDIFKKIAKKGYEYIEYETTEEYFKDYCINNNCQFLEDGARY